MCGRGRAVAGWPWPYGRGRGRWPGNLHVVGVAGWPDGRGRGRTAGMWLGGRLGGCGRMAGGSGGRLAGWPWPWPDGRVAGWLFAWPDGRAMPKLCRARVEPRLASAL